MTMPSELNHLRELELFADCGDDDLRLVASLVRRVPVASGDVMIREGSPGDEFMVIGDGSACISRETDLDRDMSGRRMGRVLNAAS